MIIIYNLNSKTNNKDNVSSNRQSIGANSFNTNTANNKEKVDFNMNNKAHFKRYNEPFPLHYDILIKSIRDNLVGFFCIKLLAGFSLWAVYTYYYSCSDAIEYFKNSEWSLCSRTYYELLARIAHWKLLRLCASIKI